MPATWGELPDAASQVVALFDGPYTQTWADRHSGRSPIDDVFRDPYLDGPQEPRLHLLVLRDAAEESEAAGRRAELADAIVLTARDAGVRASESTAEPGHLLERLADHMALVDFAAIYLALGLGLDPALSPHLADLRDRTS
jgi:hypothetical protein